MRELRVPFGRTVLPPVEPVHPAAAKLAQGPQIPTHRPERDHRQVLHGLVPEQVVVDQHAEPVIDRVPRLARGHPVLIGSGTLWHALQFVPHDVRESTHLLERHEILHDQGGKLLGGLHRPFVCESPVLLLSAEHLIDLLGHVVAVNGVQRGTASALLHHAHQLRNLRVLAGAWVEPLLAHLAAEFVGFPDCPW